MNNLYKFTFATVLGISILLCSCTPKKNYIHHSGPIQGTMFNITYASDIDYNKEIDSLLRNFNKSLSNYDPTSVISKINDNSCNRTDSLTHVFFTESEKIWTLTNGVFDISVAPIVNEWGFGWRKDIEKHVPTHETIDSLLQYVGMDKITIYDDSIEKIYPETQFITNAIAQGLSVDYVSNFFKKVGVTDFLVEIGGEIYCSGKNPKNLDWHVGIDKPVDNSDYLTRENQIIVQLTDCAINTSGNYRKFLEEGEKRYGHSIDPRNGQPANNGMLSATVIFPNCVEADAYATAFMVLGYEDAMKIVENTPEMEAYFIYLDNGTQKTAQSSGFEKFIAQ